jgi:hypothetical protein
MENGNDFSGTVMMERLSKFYYERKYNEVVEISQIHYQKMENTTKCLNISLDIGERSMEEEAYCHLEIT